MKISKGQVWKYIPDYQTVTITDVASDGLVSYTIGNKTDIKCGSLCDVQWSLVKNYELKILATMKNKMKASQHEK